MVTNKIPSKCFQGREDEVERKGEEDNNHYTLVQGSKQQYNHCNINGHIEDKCQKIDRGLNSNNHKKDAKKKNMLTKDLGNELERNLDVDEKIVCTIVQKGMNLNILYHNEDKEMKKLSHIKVQVKKTHVDAPFDSSSQANLIVVDLVRKLGLEVHDHLNPYP